MVSFYRNTNLDLSIFSNYTPKCDSKKTKHNHIVPHLALMHAKQAEFISLNIYVGIITYLSIISAGFIHLF